MKSFLEISEILILNQVDENYGMNEKKKLLNNIENYAMRICLTLNENEELYVGKSKSKILLNLETTYWSEI